MAGNPLIDQGVLNRIKGSVTLANFPNLNVTAPYLDREGINLRKEGDVTSQHGTMTGLTQSPEPYVPVSVTIALLKTQSLSDAYKSQMEDNSILGPCTVYPDVSSGLTPYQFYNMAIKNVGDLVFNGTTPLFGVVISGYWPVNNSLFD